MGQFQFIKHQARKKKNFGDHDVSFVLFLHAKEPSTIFYVSKLVYRIRWWDALGRTENTVFLSLPVPYRTNYGRYQFHSERARQLNEFERVESRA